MTETLTQYVVYHSPRDFSGYWVVRRWFIASGAYYPEPAATLCTSLDEARAVVPDDKVCLVRDPGDDPAIYEVWI